MMKANERKMDRKEEEEDNEIMITKSDFIRFSARTDRNVPVCS